MRKWRKAFSCLDVLLEMSIQRQVLQVLTSLPTHSGIGVDSCSMCNVQCQY